MPIAETDIKLYASERLNDDPDGGGFMSSTVVVDNLENNLFPDVSGLDRTLGAIDFRKVYGAVLTADTSVYYGAHSILSSIPADPAVSALLVKAANGAQDRQTLITAMQAVDSSGNRTFVDYYGTRSLVVAGAVTDRTVKVGGLYQKLIPSSTTTAAVSGSVRLSTGSDSGPVYGQALFPAGGTLPLELATGLVQGAGALFAAALVRWRAIPGSLAGTLTDAEATYTLGVSPVKGVPYITLNGALLTGPTGLPAPGQGQEAQWFKGDQFFGRLNQAVTGVSGTYQPAILVTAPKEATSLSYTSAMSPVLSITLANFSEIGSETLSWVDSLGRACSMANLGISQFYRTIGSSTSADATASIDRSTKTVTMLLNPAPGVGTQVTVSYVRTGYIQSLGAGALSASGVLNGSGELTITVSAGYKLSEGMFSISGAWYWVLNKQVVSSPPLNVQGHYSGSVVGAFNPTTGVLAIPSMAGATISNWRAVEVSTASPTPSGSTVVSGTTAANLDPASVTVSGVKISDGSAWSATANALGQFSTALVTGTYDKLTGILSLSFVSSVSSTITYVGNLNSYVQTAEAVTGVNPARFGVSGEVPLFRLGQVVVVHNEQSLAPATVVNAQTVNMGRADVADILVYGNDGARIFTGFTKDRATAAITFTNVAGYSQPVTIKHRVEDMASVAAVAPDGTITLSRALSHAYPISGGNVSYLSSALVAGDLQARVRVGFQQATWTSEFSDVRIGLGITADYNEALYPIQVTDQGAITERWALIFLTSTTFQVVGEQVGFIAAGNVAIDCAPTNPSTGAPYFTIRALGWGAGWATGNVYRSNTEGAVTPMWVLRTINPSDPFVGQDKVTLAVRGDINT